MIRFFLLCSGLLLFPSQTALSQSYPLAPEKLFFDTCQPFAEDLVFDCYRDFAEVESFLQAAADRFPNRARLESIGKTYQGRDLWLLTITDFDAGDPSDKPALWVDGGIDSDEVVATEAALGLVHRLLFSEEAHIAELLRHTTFYILPNIIPDMSELHHRSPIRPHDSTMRPWDEDNDGLLDEDPPEDLDGDNEALQMRVIDPTGDWVLDEDDNRLLRRRKLGDPGPFYSLYTEGVDNDGDGKYAEDWPGGVDPNRNYPGNWSGTQNGAGPYPGSEVELRAALDFMLSHPNIAASQHLHSSGGVILRPPSVPEMKLPAADRALYLAVAERGLEITEYPLSTSVYDWNWPRGSTNTKKGQLWRTEDGSIKGVEQAATGGNFYAPVPDEDRYAAYGGSIDGIYQLFGVLAFANEIYTFGEDTDDDGQISALERLRYQDEHMDGVVFKPWTPFEHPTLGAVEIGGWRKFGQNNPLAGDLAREVERNVDFMLFQAESMPRLVITDIEQTDLGGDVHRITMTVFNQGAQPTELAVRRESGRARPVLAFIEAENVELLSGNEEEDLGHIDGYGKAEKTWLVRGVSGAPIKIEVHHPKGGIAVTELILGE